MAMVSRSLEKMMLIAVGLTTVIVVGVPILLHTVDMLNGATQLEMASAFAGRVHDATLRVDNGSAASYSIQVSVPAGVTVTALGHTLSITYSRDGGTPVVWSKEYDHEVALIAPTAEGPHVLSVTLSGVYVHVEFTRL
ncbi:MAG: hypothetical protein HXY34_10990 [Candidatus Thorarchaeota archaeon]|nr:hypothetical protein [Candidatus Thorarchaeota archaeon]